MNRSLILKIFAEDDYKEKFIIFLIVFGAILFYLPFLSKQFIGDDWLWLANAKKALTDPSIFIGRPMYGYFRPLNMVVVALWQYIFGPNARIFSFINILLHAGNVFLLWLVLKKHDAPKSIRLISPFIFAFYYLNCAAIEWISVGHDLWVTGLMLIYLIKLKKFHEKPNLKTFIILYAIGWAAALFKESGLVAIGLYFAFFLMNKTNPYAKKYIFYSWAYIVSYTVFMVFYFLTRTMADKQIELGIPVVLNTWYFLVYLIIPIAKRIAEGLPSYLQLGLKYTKIAVTLTLPLIGLYVFYKGSKIIRVFVLWPILFVLTIAVFKWSITLFTLYPNDPASRFMYTPFVGIAVCIAWFAVKLINDVLKTKLNVILLTILGIAFIAANFIAVRKSSIIYSKQQELSQTIIDDIIQHWPVFEKADSITILTEDIAKTEQIIASGEHLPAIILVYFDKVIKISLKINQENNFENAGDLLLQWDEDVHHFKWLGEKYELENSE